VHKQKNLERGEKQPGDAEAYIKLEKKNECKLAEWKIKCTGYHLVTLDFIYNLVEYKY
jgi:hypothetical protein